MKRLTLVALALVACTSSDPTETTTTTAESPATTTEDASTAAPADESVRVIEAGQYGQAASGDRRRRAPYVLIARDADELRRLWREHVGEKRMPSIDFNSERVIFLLLGPRPTGGYAIDFVDAKREGESLRIEANLREPAEGSIVTQAFTAPYAVIAVRDLGFRSVEWINHERLLARADMEP